MKKYLHLVQDLLAYNSFKSSGDYIEPNVTYIREEEHCGFNPYIFSYSKEYFTIVSLEDNNTISWICTDSSYTQTISISTNNGKTWAEKTITYGNIILAILNNGNKLLIKGNNTAYGSSSYTSSSKRNYLSSSGNFNIEGNIMSLIYGDNFIEQTTLPATYTFYNLFYNCNRLKSAENLILPATTLTSGCYYGMFYGCTSLTTAPVLPTTTLANYCYYQMFYNCSSLTTAPELPATILAQYCYYQMFYSCSSLNYIKCLATNISATKCTYNWVYNLHVNGIFVKNPNMNSWPTGSTGILTNWDVINANDMPMCWSINEYEYSSPINTAIKPKFINPFNLPVIFSSSDNNVATINNSGIITYVGVGTCTLTALFNGDETYDAKICAFSLTVTECDYSKDYFNIVSLANNNTITWKRNSQYVPSMTISISTDNGVTWTNKTSTTSGETLATLNNGDKLYIKGINTAYGKTDYYNYFISTGNFNIEGNIMSLIYGDNFIEQITLSANYTFYNLFYHCTGLKSAENLILPATTLAYGCYYDMFLGCTSLTTAPVLPANTLADYCYRQMFYNCSSLTTAPELPATTLVSYCYHRMFEGCLSLNYIKCLATSISASNCTTTWVSAVASSGTFIKDPNMTSWTTGNNGIPSGWTVENAA